ncbi:ArsR family transcriptional regulator (plasmid) [Azospirillum argentinense]|uniref:ArsR family transcriptional regulator n=1 Tax=Azospirillum argentinense TaxID=2970906 RepID=A0A4D8PK69_9PROT|nr:ArsR family transcriptional regulator [Azospirillum argentinense]QCN98903.1 ArsR family transcriptional regulator [Azospirillum argentinense]QCN99474.1 ArsR family transcriptional regulator [Azospirillum argentinense]
MSFQTHLIEDLRLCVLRVLSEVPGCRANSSIIQTAVNALGHHVTREQVAQQIDYLASLQAVETEMVGPVKVVELRSAGENHLKRLGPPLPGVNRPRLG